MANTIRTHAHPATPNTHAHELRIPRNCSLTKMEGHHCFPDCSTPSPHSKSGNKTFYMIPDQQILDFLVKHFVAKVSWFGCVESITSFCSFLLQVTGFTRDHADKSSRQDGPVSTPSLDSDAGLKGGQPHSGQCLAAPFALRIMSVYTVRLRDYGRARTKQIKRWDVCRSAISMSRTVCSPASSTTFLSFPNA